LQTGSPSLQCLLEKRETRDQTFCLSLASRKVRPASPSTLLSPSLGLAWRREDQQRPFRHGSTLPCPSCPS
jgi:hypothetical protein